MAWNKNTINETEINTVSDVLTATGTTFYVKTIGTVMLYGKNDDRRVYNIRHLKFTKKDGNEVHYLEQMIRTLDSDIDDVVVSFQKETIVKDGKKIFAGKEENNPNVMVEEPRWYLERIVPIGGDKDTVFANRVFLDLDNGFTPG